MEVYWSLQHGVFRSSIALCAMSPQVNFGQSLQQPSGAGGHLFVCSWMMIITFNICGCSYDCCCKTYMFSSSLLWRRKLMPAGNTHNSFHLVSPNLQIFLDFTSQIWKFICQGEFSPKWQRSIPSLACCKLISYTGSFKPMRCPAECI